ncbi:hypothetical protein K456DRAFT_1724165 [Colletotrichum gloeosporioides 23]|nr:hypothetical protein K456DRAFT_1724165 [Colletotrichum gloeosporioides 23]
MASGNNVSGRSGNAADKTPHVYSSAESSRELAERRFASFDAEPSSSSGNTHHVSSQAANATVTREQHKTRINNELTQIMAPFNGQHA